MAIAKNRIRQIIAENNFTNSNQKEFFGQRHRKIYSLKVTVIKTPLLVWR